MEINDQTMTQAADWLRPLTCLPNAPRTDDERMGSVITLLRLAPDEAHAKKLVARCLAGCSRYPLPLTMRRVYVEVVGEPADGLKVEMADLTEFEAGPPMRKAGA